MSKENTETSIIPISETGELVYTHWDALTAISKKIMDAGICKLGNPAQINLVIMAGKQLGISMFQALENITVINNKTSISGALAMALVYRSGLLEDRTKAYVGEGDDRKCVCTTKRKGQSKTTCEFSIKDAKKAGLYPGKQGSGWSSYPDRMLFWRAMGFCLREDFSDVIQGLYLSEELADEVHEIKIVTDAAPPEVKKAPADPDPEDTAKAMAHPLIADPSHVIKSTEPEKTDETSTKVIEFDNHRLVRWRSFAS